MSYTEDQLLPISGLQHLLFCERQCALIHVEQAWAENRLTIEGKHLHDRVHDRGHESRREMRVETAVQLRSLEHGLTGVADVTEFHRREGEGWMPFPVEYKRGKPKTNQCDNVQLCAQMLCLEEMLGIKIAQGALFYGKTHQRTDVFFDVTLRKLTADNARRFHELIAAGVTPPPEKSSKCGQCSLRELCMPDVPRRASKVADYVYEAIV